MAHVTAMPAAVRSALPRPIRKALGRVDRRLRRQALMKGLGTAGLIGAVGAAAAMGADLAWGLPQGVRWGVWGAWVFVTAVPLLAGLARAARRRGNDLALAGVLEHADANLGDRLTGAVDLLEGPRHGSPALIGALADDAAARVAAVDPARAAPSGKAWRRLALGALAAAVVAAPAVWKDDPFGALARRFLTPWHGSDRVGLFAVAVEPGDVVVAKGDDVKISATVAPRLAPAAPAADPGAAWLEWTDAETGKAQRLAMGEAGGAAASAGSDQGRAFRAVLPKVTGSLTYRVVSRSGESRTFKVDAVDPPRVAAVAAKVEPPGYMKLPPVDARNPARIEAFEGSRVTLTVTTAGPVAAVEVVWPTPGAGPPGAVPFEAAVGKGGKTAAFQALANVSGAYEIKLKDAHDLKNRAEPPRRLLVRPDGPPTVAVRTPGGGETKEARRDDTLRVAVAARDDVAVAAVELHYKVERAAGSTGGKDEGRQEVRVRGLGTAAARGEAVLALKPLGVRPGDVVSWRVRVADNRPAPKGPNVVWSAEHRLTVVARADPLWALQGEAGREGVQAELDALKKAAAENRRATEQLRYAADAARNGNGAFDRDKARDLARREAAARELVEGLHAFSRRLEDDPAFHPLARPARQAADVEAEAARATLDQARQDDDPARRFADLRLADTRLGAVALRLEEIQRDLNALAEREADVRRLQGLADRQAEVAAHAGADDPKDADAAPPDRLRLDRLAAEQNAVRNELDALLRKSPDLRAEVLAAEAEKAEELARRAHEVAAHQRDEARRATDLSRKADALRALAEEQRAVEEDARRLALDVDAPLVENGRAGLNVEPIRRAAEPLERGELAPGRDGLVNAENELRRLARDLEDAPGDLKALAGRLARRQEQVVNDLSMALGEERSKPNLADAERAALAKRLEPLAARQRAVAALAAAVLKSRAAKEDLEGEAKFPRDAARKAAEATSKAAASVKSAANPREAETRAAEARDALHRLANELPDAGRRENAARQAFQQARQDADAVANEIDRHLNETNKPWDANYPPAKAAAELNRRLEPLADRLRQAADRLAKVPPVPRARPQTDRAARRARALAAAVEAARTTGKHDPNAPPPPDFDADRARALRDALAAASLESRLGFERLEQKLNGATPAEEVADELADEHRALARGKGEPAARAADQRRLAAALRHLRAPDAAPEQAEAVRLAARAAEAGDPAAVELAAEAAAALADRLNDRQSPRDRVRALARAERGLNDPAVGPPDPAAEIARQRDLTAALARLPIARDKGRGEAVAVAAADAALRAAAVLAERARAPEEAVPGQGKPTPADRAAARDRAAAALDALATRLGPGPETDPAPNPPGPVADAPRDPDLPLDPGHATRARELARRERRLREKVLAVLADEVKPQQDVRREAVEVGRELADLRDRAGAISPRAAGPAAESASLLGEQAPQAMDAAADQLAQGQADPARDAQRNAADLAERGARRADDLAAALRAEQPRDAAAQDKDAAEAAAEDPAALAAARAAMAEAAQSLGQARQPSQPSQPAALPAARRAMHAAAGRLQAAAEAARSRGRDEPGRHPDRGRADATSPAAEPTGQRAGVADAESLQQIQDLVRRTTGRKWGELPGHLRSEILQMSQGRYRDDYARLIQLYFREISAGPSNPGEQP